MRDRLPNDLGGAERPANKIAPRYITRASVDHHEAWSAISKAIDQAYGEAIVRARAVAPLAKDQVDIGAVLRHVTDGPMHEIGRKGFLMAARKAADGAADIAAAFAASSDPLAFRLDLKCRRRHFVSVRVSARPLCAVLHVGVRPVAAGGGLSVPLALGVLVFDRLGITRH